MKMTEILKEKIKKIITSEKVWCDAASGEEIMEKLYDKLSISEKEISVLED